MKSILAPRAIPNVSLMEDWPLTCQFKAGLQHVYRVIAAQEDIQQMSLLHINQINNPGKHMRL